MAVWLIFTAFTIGLGFVKTGLGKCISLYRVKTWQINSRIRL
ncbi:anion permease [Helicobacter mastomyrinus]|uniref:Anion permease n=1 Tax=Helicobacter mastomyrinus TaxID=287948 RepID=A0ABZ3F5Z7_9HELI|nr:anion permease [uncultured Helicobacter sp.]